MKRLLMSTSMIVLSAIMFMGQPAVAKIAVQGYPLIKPYPDSKVWASQVVKFDKVAFYWASLF